MAATAIVLPIGALMAFGGFDALVAGVSTAQVSGGEATTVVNYAGPAALGFIIGTLGIGLGYPGQPHVVNRLMALRNDRALRSGRFIAIIWATVVYAGMILLGFCGRILGGGLADGEQIFFTLTNSLFSPVVSGLMIAAVLSAIVSTADSQLLVVASSVSHDWFGGTRLRSSRYAVVLLSVLAMILAIGAPATIFDRVLFAWHAVGSALGPLLLLSLAAVRVKPKFVLGSIWIGFGTTVMLHWFPDSPGDWLERLVPFLLASGFAVIGRRKPTR